MATNTDKLDLLLIQPTWPFGDESFNRFIKDADNKLVGVAHLTSPMHWTEWKPETIYAKGDVVRYPNLKSHQYAVCISVSGTSDIEANMPTNNITGSIFIDNTVKWEVRSLTEADANGGTIKIWLSGSYYFRGDAVRYGDALYRAKIDHEAGSTFSADENKWQEIYASIRFWKPNVYYYLDDTAIYDDIIYKCIEAHTSVANFESDSSATPSVVGDEDKWEIIGGAGGAKDWETNKKYQVGQLVLVNGILYRCNTKHKSNATAFQNDIANWDLVNAQIKEWEANKYYVAGTLVSYNDVIYKCLTNHTASANFTSDIDKWNLYHNHITIWDRNKSYYQGQIILYENRLYRCNTTHVSSNEITEEGITRDATFGDDIVYWNVLYASWTVWEKDTAYKIGDTVLYNNEPFRCVNNHTSGNTSTSTIFDDMTSSLSTNCWERIKLSNPYITNWDSNTIYDVNQLVMYNNTLYRCNSFHTSASVFDSTKWDLVYANIQTWTTDTPYKVNSMVLNDNKLYVCITAHTSDDFSEDAENWVEIGGAVKISDWQTATAYSKDSFIFYGGTLYRCNVAHTSTTFSADSSKWDKIYASIVDWAANTYYQVGTTILYDNVIYKCSTAHTSSTAFDATKWALVYANIRKYAKDIIYKQGSIVLYNNQLYECLQNYTSTSDDFTLEMNKPDTVMKYPESQLVYSHPGSGWRVPPDIVVWDLGSVQSLYSLSLGDSAPYTGNGCTVYEIEAAVSIDGINYTTVINHNDPSQYALSVSAMLNGMYVRYIKLYVIGVNHNWPVELKVSVATNLQYWRLLSSSMIQHWLPNTLYTANSAVLYNGELYICTKVHTSSTTLEINSDCWYKIAADAVVGDWQAKVDYGKNYIISHEGILYRCNARHTSDLSFSSDLSYWDRVFANIVDWKTNTYYPVNTIVLYDKEFYKCKVSHTSSTDSLLTKIDYTNDTAFIAYDQGAWGRTETPIEYVVDLGDIQNLTKIEFNQVCNRLLASDIDIFISENGTDYENIYNYHNESTDIATTGNHIEAICFNSARYIKIVVNTLLTPWIGDFPYGGYLTNLKVSVLSTDWELLGKNTTEIHDWKTDTMYVVNEVVVSDGKIYRCKEPHLSTVLQDDIDKWDIIGGDFTIATKAQIDALFI